MAEHTCLTPRFKRSQTLKEKSGKRVLKINRPRRGSCWLMRAACGFTVWRLSHRQRRSADERGVREMLPCRRLPSDKPVADGPQHWLQLRSVGGGSSTYFHHRYTRLSSITSVTFVRWPALRPGSGSRLFLPVHLSVHRRSLFFFFLLLSLTFSLSFFLSFFHSILYSLARTPTFSPSSGASKLEPTVTTSALSLSEGGH